MNGNKNIDALCYYVLNKIDFNVLKSLSPEQLSAIEGAIDACQLRTKHAVDVRGKIYLYFSRLYFVFFVGRDRRAFVQDIEEERRGKMNALGNLIYFMFVSAAVIFAFTALLIIGLYVLKISLGIDIFPGRHMGEIIGLRLWPFHLLHGGL
ncbi:MAG: hypothetical protein HY757_09015 [Nitrospirae bacterium]|nr:hypothetical protein [Nitrospirota bacterium]